MLWVRVLMDADLARNSKRSAGGGASKPSACKIWVRGFDLHYNREL